MVGSRIDYPDLATEAARMVMLELVRILGEYKDSMAIVGGWVPELLFANARPKHIGSIDVDMPGLAGLLDDPMVDQELQLLWPATGDQVVGQLLAGNGVLGAHDWSPVCRSHSSASAASDGMPASPAASRYCSGSAECGISAGTR